MGLFMEGALGLLVGVSAPASLTTPPNLIGQPPPVLTQQGRADERHIPVVDYHAPESSDAAERTKRREKSRRYTGKQIKEEPRVSVVTESDSPVERLPALPVAESSVVVVGEVAGACAYLSDGRLGVYSEFAVRVERTLKSDRDTALNPGASIIAEREGGGVGFPSGHVQLYLLARQRMPKVGSKYVLFLKRNEAGQDFLLLTGYELRAGRVYPLDGLGKHEAYKGMGEDEFIGAVHGAID